MALAFVAFLFSLRPHGCEGLITGRLLPGFGILLRLSAMVFHLVGFLANEVDECVGINVLRRQLLMS